MKEYMYVKENLFTFLDAAQRTIIGEVLLERSTEQLLVIRNPVVVNIVPQMDPNTRQPTGQMALQLLPLFFREFMGDKSDSTIYSYPRNGITLIDKFPGGWDFRLYEQYKHTFMVQEAAQQATPTAPAQEQVGAPIINLFKE